MFFAGLGSGIVLTLLVGTLIVLASSVFKDTEQPERDQQEQRDAVRPGTVFINGQRTGLA